MPEMTTIRSAQNERIKHVARLQRQSSFRRKIRRFCIEMQRDYARAVDAGLKPEAIYIHEKYDPDELLPSRPADVPVFRVSDNVLKKISYRENPQGFVAVFEMPGQSFEWLASIFAKPGPWVLVLSGLEKPGNVGAILRTAEGAGVDAVVIDDPAFDLYNPNVIRASTGVVFHLPIHCAQPGEILTWLSDHDFRLIAATPEATDLYTQTGFAGAIAMLLGAEAEGLSDAWLEHAHAAIRIPMAGVADSLNVSVTAGIIMYEARRQRDGGV